MKWRQRSVFFAPWSSGLQSLCSQLPCCGESVLSLAFPFCSLYPSKRFSFGHASAGTWRRSPWHSPEAGSPPPCILFLPLSLSAPSLVTYPVFTGKEHKLRIRWRRCATVSKQRQPQDSGPAWWPLLLPNEVQRRWAKRPIQPERFSGFSGFTQY